MDKIKMNNSKSYSYSYDVISNSLSRKLLIPFCTLGVLLIIMISILIPFTSQTLTHNHVKDEVTKTAIAIAKIDEYCFDLEITQSIIQIIAEQ